MNLTKILSLALAMVVLVAAPVPADARSGHRKIDQITLFNGDKITGEIKRLYGGLIELSTDAMGTINIEWQEIARVESTYHYEVRMSDGARYYGSLDGDSRPGELALRDIYGDHYLENLQVVELRPVEQTFADRLEVYLSAGYSYTKASSVAQTSFMGDVSYENEAGKTALSGRTTITDTDDSNSTSTKLTLRRQLWTNRDRLFRTFFTTYEDNDELSLDHRVSVGMGYGRYFIDTHKVRLMGAAGLQATTERGSEGGDEQQNLEMFINGSFATWRFETPELNLDVGGNLYPSITESGRLRADYNVRLSWELIKDLTLDITGWGTYDNKSDSENTVDYGLTTGIGWKY